jgi:hypothetical protein
MYIAKKSLLGEIDLNAKGHSQRDEKRILDALSRGLLKEFPNPDRVGCPGSEVLRRVASRAMPLSEADKWLDHLGSCSPCYRDFLQFQSAHRARHRQTLLAIAASILVVVSLTGWAVRRSQKQSPGAQTAVLDLRNRSLSRGGESNSVEPPLEVNRSVKHLTVYLPLGSAEGPYEMRIITTAGDTVFTTSAVASLKQGATSLETAIDLPSASSGQYVFQVRRPNLEWNSYAVLLR